MLMLIFSGACSKAPEETEEAAAPVPTVHVKIGSARKGAITEAVDVPGVISALPNSDVKVSFLVSGRITDVFPAEGDNVRKGQLVARLDSTTYREQHAQAQASVRQAEASLENARKEMERNRSLFQKGIAAGKEVQDSEAQFRVAQAELQKSQAARDAAQIQVDRCQLFAPLSGVVLKRLLNSGEQATGSPSDPVLEIGSIDVVEMEARVPSRYLTKVRPGNRMPIVSPSYPDNQFSGQILTVAGAVDPTTDTAEVRLRVQNPGRLLRVAMYVQAKLVLQRHPDTVLVPATAVVKSEKGSSVYTVQKDMATRRPVVVGLQEEGSTEIISGVSAGEIVLISGNYGLEDKAHIIIDK